MTEIVIASGNPGKIREFKEVLGEGVISQKEAGADFEVIEDGETFRENALKKAREVHEATGKPTLADDSGLCVLALNGAPGVFSARYSGLGDDENNKKLLREMAEITDRRAYFVAAIAYVDSEVQFVAEETWEGEIAHEIKGEGGFGYDKVFIPAGYSVHSSQLDLEEKNRISHRGKALCEMKNLLEKA